MRDGCGQPMLPREQIVMAHAAVTRVAARA
jgi:hypothetical protein